MWKTTLARRMDESFSVQGEGAAIYTAFAHTAQKLEATELQLQQLASSDTQVALRECQAREEASIQERVAAGALYASEVATRKDLEAQVVQLEKRWKEQQRTAAKTEKEMQERRAEMVKKNRAMDAANDTVLSLEIECNVLRERVAETERENAMLVARWLAEKEAQATRMNEMLR